VRCPSHPRYRLVFAEFARRARFGIFTAFPIAQITRKNRLPTQTAACIFRTRPLAEKREASSRSGTRAQPGWRDGGRLWPWYTALWVSHGQLAATVNTVDTASVYYRSSEVAISCSLILFTICRHTLLLLLRLLGRIWRMIVLWYDVICNAA